MKSWYFPGLEELLFGLPLPAAHHSAAPLWVGSSCVALRASPVCGPTYGSAGTPLSGRPRFGLGSVQHRLSVRKKSTKSNTRLNKSLLLSSHGFVLVSHSSSVVMIHLRTFPVPCVQGAAGGERPRRSVPVLPLLQTEYCRQLAAPAEEGQQISRYRCLLLHAERQRYTDSAPLWLSGQYDQSVHKGLYVCLYVWHMYIIYMYTHKYNYIYSMKPSSLLVSFRGDKFLSTWKNLNLKEWDFKSLSTGRKNQPRTQRTWLQQVKKKKHKTD